MSYNAIIRAQGVLIGVLGGVVITAFLILSLDLGMGHRAVSPQEAPDIISETIILEPLPGDWNTMPDCPQEDSGFTMTCKWDAGSSGNGEGLSFWGDGTEILHYVYIPKGEAS